MKKLIQFISHLVLLGVIGYLGYTVHEEIYMLFVFYFFIGCFVKLFQRKHYKCPRCKNPYNGYSVSAVGADQHNTLVGVNAHCNRCGTEKYYQTKVRAGLLDKRRELDLMFTTKEHGILIRAIINLGVAFAIYYVSTMIMYVA